jgi:hypothetical protein
MDEPGLPPHLEAQRAHVEALADRFVGLSAEEATCLAEQLGIDLRLYGAGDAITADFRPARLNGELDGDGRVARTRLG